MKILKRIMSVALILVLLTAMFVPASAAGNKTITINNADSGHSFEAYQIFSGSLSGNILSNITWGTGVDPTNLLAALKADATIGSLFTDCTTAEQVAAVLEDKDNWQDAYTDIFAKIVSGCTTASKYSSGYSAGVYTISVPAGYYFVKDISDNTGENHAYTKYIIHVTTNVAVNVKSAVPTMSKQVSTSAGSGFTEAVSASVGDYVYFKLTANLKDRMNDYPEYYIQFVDILPKGLEYVEVASLKVSGHAIGTDEYGFNADSSAARASDGTHQITFTMPKVKEAVKTETGAAIVEGDNIELVFKAKVLSDITVNAKDGNTNNAYLKYSNNPNIADPASSLGITSKHMAKVYSYGLAVDKIDAADATKKLANAKFKVYRSTSGGNEYVVANNNGVVTGWTTTEADATEFVTNSDGAFTVKGLGKNTYFLKETLAPAGYNSIKSDISVSFVASFNLSTGSVEGFTGSVTGHGHADLNNANADTGIVTITVKNSLGATLPETGGMGTTVFYIVGLVLVLGAAVLLISRRRKSSEG